ncbi:MAG: DUF1015 family protein [Phycisphaerales bacterium]
MPRLFPIQNAVTFGFAPSPGETRDISKLIAPPYDLIGPTQKAALLDAAGENIVGIDAASVPAGDETTDDRYRDAATRLDEFLSRRVFAPHSDPCVFVLRQTFHDHEGLVHRRGCLFGEIQAQPFSTTEAPDGLFAHEETGAGACEDRLSLLQTTRAQTSPIFGLYSDESGAVEDRLRKLMLESRPALAGVNTDGTLHELWPVSDPAAMESLLEAFGSRAVMIADGHHRFEAARRYLDALPGAAPDDPRRRILFGLVATQDLGMSVGAVHRLYSGVRGFSIDRFKAAANSYLHITPLGSDLRELPAAVAAESYARSHVMGWHDFAMKRSFVLSTHEIDPLGEQYANESTNWRGLDPVIAEALIERRILQDGMNGGRPVVRRSAYSIDDVISAARERPQPQAALVLAPTPLDEVVKVATTGRRLPVDSTFFWPKLASGLVLKLFGDPQSR